MTEYLIRHFVPNYTQVRDSSVRERYGALASFVCIVCNALLFSLKIVIGNLTNSISITADAINNLSDGLSSVIALIGFRISNKAPDAAHPFGYGRTEYISGFIVSFLILQVGFEFLKTSISRILHPTHVTCNWILIGILFASLFVKLWMGLFTRHIGQKIQSPTLLATMQDSINDVITSLVVIIGMIASPFISFPIDGYIGLLVALFILWAGFNIAKDTLNPLLGEPADPKVVKEIEDVVLSMDGIIGVHDLIIHNYGSGKSIASLHAEVPDTANFVAVHEVIDDAERQVWKQLGIFLVIHMDPVTVNNARINHFRQTVMSVLNKIDSRITMHDFRVVDGEHHMNLIFDIVVPFEYQNAKEEKLLSHIRQALTEKDPRYRTVITVDRQM